MQGLGVSAYVHAFFQRVPGLIPMSIAGDCMLWAAAEFRYPVARHRPYNKKREARKATDAR